MKYRMNIWGHGSQLNIEKDPTALKDQSCFKKLSIFQVKRSSYRQARPQSLHAGMELLEIVLRSLLLNIQSLPTSQTQDCQSLQSRGEKANRGQTERETKM
jgi:hypothetical protein